MGGNKLANEELTAAGLVPAVRDKSACEGRVARLWWLPSLTALSFLLSIVLLYWQVGGPSGLLADPSTGVHIRTGQWILAHHVIPRHDLFSFTLTGKPWCDWEWLSDVIFAAAYRLHGLSGVAALSLAVLCLTSVVIYRTARRHAGPIVACAVCGLAMATTTIHWLARPHLFTWPLLAVLCWFLEKVSVEGRRRWLCALPCLMVLWVNLHPGFVAGFLVLGAWLAGNCLSLRFGSRREDHTNYRLEANWCCFVLAACAVATLVNPHFVHLPRHIASYLMAPSTVTAHVSEWLSPDFHNARLAWFEILLPLAGAAGVWHGLKRRLYWCVVIFGFMYLALLSVRNVPLFAIVCAVPLAAGAEDALAEFDYGRMLQEVGRALEGMKRGWGTVAVWGLGLALIGAVSAAPVRLGKAIPIEAIRRLPSDRIFTTDRWADYLISAEPGRKVFFDGRNDFYGPAFVESYLRVMKAEPGWDAILDKYRVSVAMVPMDSSISAALRHDTSWRDVYRDSEASVFEKRDQSRLLSFAREGCAGAALKRAPTAGVIRQ
ncbi:MAG TPA: hypothetical protein VFZ08_04380 [Terriglobia bacterium]|nr:hypothetical protein [Terriglobia bacterium]